MMVGFHAVAQPALATGWSGRGVSGGCQQPNVRACPWIWLPSFAVAAVALAKGPVGTRSASVSVPCFGFSPSFSFPRSSLLAPTHSAHVSDVLLPVSDPS